MIDLLLQYIPAHEAQLVVLVSSFLSFLSLLFAFFARTTALSKILGTISIADLGRVVRYAIKLLRWLAEFRKARKIIAGSLLVCVAFGALGCSGTFEESSAKLTVGPRKAADPTLCRQLSRRATVEKALIVTLATTTGAQGIAAWPVEGKNWELGLAIGATVTAAGTAFVTVLYDADAREYIEAGCAQTKQAAQATPHEKIQLLNDIGLLEKTSIDAQHQWAATLGPEYNDATREAMREAVAIIEAEKKRLLLRAVEVTK